MRWFLSLLVIFVPGVVHAAAFVCTSKSGTGCAQWYELDWLFDQASNDVYADALLRKMEPHIDYSMLDYVALAQGIMTSGSAIDFSSIGVTQADIALAYASGFGLVAVAAITGLAGAYVLRVLQEFMSSGD